MLFRFTQSGYILLSLKSKNDKLRVSVRDTGIGIQPYRLEKLFDLFESLDSNGQLAHGFGLKLHVSNLIAQRLGNERISVKSRENRGTIFKFNVNIQDDILNTSTQDSENLEENVLANTLPITKSKKSFMKHSPRVLVVDDNEFNRIIIGEFLKQEFIDYDEAINGLIACQLVEHRNRLKGGYSVVIMDIQMPVMDGWQATRRLIDLHRRGEIESCPVIIGYSAYSGVDEETRARDAGMTELLLKPTPKSELLRVIKRYL